MAQPQAALGLPGIWETWPEPDSSNWALALTKTRTTPPRRVLRRRHRLLLRRRTGRIPTSQRT
jgi:hypothetical protein